jgi:rhodanese-related sulfurtransferase
MAEGYQLIDVRMAVERKSGFIQDSINIPLDDLRSRLNELDPDRPYIVSCQAGLRSYIAERILRQHGFNVLNLDGAYGLYSVIRPEISINK